MKKKLTNKEWLIIALSIFYSVFVMIAGLGMDAEHVVIPKKNIFEGIANMLQIPKMAGTPGIFIMLLFICLFLVAFPLGAIFFKRKLQANNESVKSTKAIIIYLSLFFGSFILAFGIGTLFQIPNEGMKNYGVTLQFVFGSILVGTLVFLVIGGIIWGAVGLIYYFFLRNHEKEDDIPKDEDLEDKAIDGDLSTSFTGVGGTGGTITGPATVTAGGGTGTLGGKVLGPKEEVFKNLVAIDDDPSLITANDFENEDVTLKSLVDGLQGYLATTEHLYYDKRELADFIAGLAASKLIILEGISGTGKSSLPRFFAKYIGESAYFEPIQVTYKEKSDIVGFYNELTGVYNETPFLKRLYRAGYERNKINLMVLDEMNISRVEYYFADFLSVMEFPENERYISLMTLPDDYEAPNNLMKGELLISPNTYFIGTANKDDSTFTITDKVIDRAIVINFDETQQELKFEEEFNPISLTFDNLTDLFTKAKEEHPFKDEDRQKLLELIRFVASELGIVTGNRILKQIDTMVPIYLAMGFDITDCYDAVMANKILRKLETKFDQGLSNSLNKFLKKLDELYGKNTFKYSRRLVEKYLRRLI